MDLQEFPYKELSGGLYGKETNSKVLDWVNKINTSKGLHFVVPEYNGSFPGALKLFIDYWKYPDCFEQRPVCFVGLGGQFGGLRPVEQLQQVLGYRNAFVFPQRIFFNYVWNVLGDEGIKDPLLVTLLKDQVSGFRKFIAAIDGAGLDANALNLRRLKKE